MINEILNKKINKTTTIFKNRTEVINHLTNKSKNRNVLYISPANSIIHEVSKTIVFYYLKKGYEYDSDIIQNLLDCIKPELEEIDKQFKNHIKGYGLKPKEKSRLILVEPEMGCDKIDLILADEKLLIELDYKHLTGEDKIKRLEAKGFKVEVLKL